MCGTIVSLISPGDCTLQCGMWHWNHDIEFSRSQHPAMWQVALGWHAIELAQMSAILEFYIWFRSRPHHHSRHVILHQPQKFYPNRTTLGRKKRRNVNFQDGGSQRILDFRDPIMGSLKSPITTSCRSSIDTIALNCLVFEKIMFFCILVIDRQTNRWIASMH